MIISVNWLKKFTDITLSINELTDLIGARLVEIESVESLADKYKDVIIVKVVSCMPMPDSDHLNVTKIDDGRQIDNVERDENGFIQVVCGASNVTSGMLAAWLPPASVVPNTFYDAQPFVLGARELRGFISNGMLASAKELDLYDEHDGILVVDKSVVPGSLFAEVYELDDYLLDIENKSLTHRPDAFGIIGFAREISGIQGRPFRSPDWLLDLQPHYDGNGSIEVPIVTIDDPLLSDRFQAVVLADINGAAQSSLEIQTYLARSGIRPISAIVDVTNYMMLLTGHPLHAYDYDKLLAIGGGVADLHVRSARKDETLGLLDSRIINLSEDDIVIANGETVIGLAGAMGGANTEIDASTTRILLEAATFNLYKLRAVQMRHGVFTEAITRFTKGLPGALGTPVLVEASKMMGQLAGASVVSEIADTYPGQHEPVVVSVQETAVNNILGTQFSSTESKNLLENVEFAVSTDGAEVFVKVPYWRNDIHIAEDIVEEIGRLSGFDLINPVLPLRDFTAVLAPFYDRLRTKLRSTLVRTGANEALTYSFIHGDVMRKAGQDPETAYRIVNSISPDLQYYRQSLTPSLLHNIQPNVKAGYSNFALFEINKRHTKLVGLTAEAVPRELESLAFIVASGKTAKSATYYEAKRYLDYIATELGLEFRYEPLEADVHDPLIDPFEPLRSARVSDARTLEQIGVIGEFKRSVRKGFKLTDNVAGFEIAPQVLASLVKGHSPSYYPISKYPGTERDICFQVATSVPYQQVYSAAKAAIDQSNIKITISPLDIYQPVSGETKNITLRVMITAYDKTLTGNEIHTIMAEVTDKVTAATHGKVL